MLSLIITSLQIYGRVSFKTCLNHIRIKNRTNIARELKRIYGRREKKLFVIAVVVDCSVNLVSADVILAGHVVTDDVIAGDVTPVNCWPQCQKVVPVGKVKWSS